MNYIHLILLYQLIPSGVVSNNVSPPPHNIKFGITLNNKVVSRVNLKQTKRVLANEHLPIWIAITNTPTSDSSENMDGHELIKQYGVMEQLGEFTTYQETQTTSAAIYFHKRRELDGVIDYRTFIHQLSIDKIHSMGESLLVLNRDNVYARKYAPGHEYAPPNDDPRAGVNYHGHLKTYDRHLYDGYPEILVLVAWDVIDWSKVVEPVDSYTSIVSNVLTLFNAVDMLYSKLEYTNIQINIAGIVIEAKQNAFRFLTNCKLSPNNEKNATISRLDIACVNRALEQYVIAQKKTIRPDSYDVAIILTRQRLFTISANNGKPTKIAGVAISYKSLFDRRLDDKPLSLVAAVWVGEYWENYVTIAHELAHSMNVEHDWLPFFTWDKKCCGNIMKTFDGWCLHCLSWSKTTERSFNLFFSSPHCCQFINKPQSLKKPARREVLTAEEQCRCYGYRTSEMYNSKINSRREFCKERNICHGGPNDQSHQLIVPMDGTLCGERKVCWQKECQEMEESQPQRENAGWFWG